jgi:hypothetical protein
LILKGSAKVLEGLSVEGAATIEAISSLLDPSFFFREEVELKQ